MALSELRAPQAWKQIDLLSDLHLDARTSKTLEALRQHGQSNKADALIILGDLAEVWVGDDAADEAGSSEAQLMDLLGELASRRPVYFMVGNRDFLLSEARLKKHHVQLLSDPCVLSNFGRRVLLTHGDALCLADHDYQEFRASSRQANWIKNLLSKPLAQRRAYATAVRTASQTKRQDPNVSWADVDASAAVQSLLEHDATLMIHGHTHRPDDHDLGRGLSRVVLSDWDWDTDSNQRRGDVISLTRTNWCRCQPGL